MGQIYWHIGMSKTGTSAIQAFLTLNEKILKNENIDFPNPPDINNQQAFQTTAGNGLNVFNLIINNNEEDLTNLMKKYNKSKMNTLVSSEMLISAFIRNIDLCIKMIKKFDIKVIVYIRKQDDFLMSDYNQLVKNHGMYDDLDFNREKLSYYTIIEYLIDTLSNENLIIRPYDKKQFKDSNIFSDFLNCINLEFKDKYELPGKIVNPSLTLDTLDFKKSLNKVERYYSLDLNKDITEINKHILNYVVNNQGEGEPFKNMSLLTRNEREKVLEKYKDFNDKIARYIGQDKLFSDAEYSDRDDFKKEVNIEDYLNISKHILKKIDSEKAESNFKTLDEEIKKLIACYTADVIIDKKYETTEFNNLTNDGKYSLIYKLDSKPEKVSKFVESIDYIDCKLKLKSNGNDPFFVIEDFKNNKSKNLLIKIDIQSEKASFVEIFYANQTEGFIGNRRNHYPIKKGVNTFFAYLEHDKVITRLRFDIGNTIGEYTINSLEVYGQ